MWKRWVNIMKSQHSFCVKKTIILMLCVFVCIMTCFFLCKRRKGEMYLELNCEIIKLADYKNIHEKLAPIEVSKYDLEDRIKEILDTYGQKSVSLEFIEKEFLMRKIFHVV